MLCSHRAVVRSSFFQNKIRQIHQVGIKYCHQSLESTISCKIFHMRHSTGSTPAVVDTSGSGYYQQWIPYTHLTPFNWKCSISHVSHFWVPDRYWSPWLTINTRLMNILVFLMSLLRSKYDSLLTIADGFLLAAVAPSIIYLHFTCFIRNIWFVQLCWQVLICSL